MSNAQISASFETLTHQASDTAHGYLFKAIASVQQAYDDPKAHQKYPEVVAALVNAASRDLAASVTAKVLQEALGDITTALDDMDTSGLDRLADTLADHVSNLQNSDN